MSRQLSCPEFVLVFKLSEEQWTCQVLGEGLRNGLRKASPLSEDVCNMNSVIFREVKPDVSGLGMPS